MTSTEPIAYMGHWWIAGEDPRDAQPGRLVIDPDKSVRVELIGGFVPMVVIPEGQPGAGTLSPRPTIPVVYGQCGDDRFTLLGVITSSSINGILDRPQQQLLQPERALQGRYLIEDAGGAVIQAVRAEFDYLLFFSQLTALAVDDDFPFTDEVGATRATASVSNPPEFTASWGELRFRLTLARDLFNSTYENPNLFTVNASQRAVLEVQFDNPVTVAEADQIGKAMQDLLTLAMNKPCANRATYYKTAQPEPLDDWERERAKYRPEFNLTAYGRQVFQPDSVPFADPRRDYLFTLRDLPFGELIPRWMDLYGRATVGIQMLMGARYLDVGYVSSRLSTVCIALEALHSALYDQPRMAAEEFEALVEAAANAVEEPHREMVRQQLSNRVSYSKRARQLTQKIRGDTCRLALGKPNRWVNMVTTARNDLAHANDGGFDAGRHLFLMMITQLTLSLVLAHELGIDDDRLHEFTKSAWGLTSRWKEVIGDVS